MGRKDPSKPKGKMSSYAYFVQNCREEHKKKHPDEQVVFAEFSKKCGGKWKSMGPKEKGRFEDMALKDKARYESEMEDYEPPAGEQGIKRKRTKKDPNAPKRALSAFFCFCADERPKVRAMYPDYGVGDVAKELGKRWGVCRDKPKHEAAAAKDKARYAKAIAIYNAGAGAGEVKAAKKAKTVAPPPPPPVSDDDDDDDDDEDDEEDEYSD